MLYQITKSQDLKTNRLVQRIMSINKQRISTLKLRKRGFVEFIAPKLARKKLGKILAVELDKFLFDIVDVHKIKYFIECGANQAEASKALSAKGVYTLAIEANPYTFKKYTEKKIDRYKAKNIGLGKTDGFLDFHIPKADLTAGNATFQPDSGIEYTTTKVATKKLDDVVTEFVANNNNYGLWIDVEGFQREVLEGAKQSLSSPNCSFVKIEMESKPHFSEKQILAEEIHGIFTENNFTPIFCDFEFDT